jgi:hypothetical protein
MRKLRTFTLAALIGSAAIGSASAQAALVLDTPNLLQAIDSLYAHYDEIMQTIENVKNTYMQLEQSIKAVQGMNWDDISLAMSDHNGIPDIRDPIRSVMKQVNHNMNLLNNVQDTLTKKKVSIGGRNYTIAGLVGLGEPGTTILDLPLNAVDYTRDAFKDAAKGFDGKLTEADRTRIMERYGMSARNYYTLKQTESLIKDTVTALFSWGTDTGIDAVVKDVATNNQAIVEMMNSNTDSQTVQLQSLTTACMNISTAIGNLQAGFNRYSGYIATKDILDKQQKENEADFEESQQKARNVQSQGRSAIPPGF